MAGRKPAVKADILTDKAQVADAPVKAEPAADKAPKKWKCLEKCYVGERLYYPGDIVDVLPDAKGFFASV